MFTWVFMYVCMRTCECIRKSEINFECLPQSLSTSVLVKVSLMPKFTKFSSSAWTGGPSVSLPPHPWDCKCMAAASGFYVGAGTELRPPCLLNVFLPFTLL